MTEHHITYMPNFNLLVTDYLNSYQFQIQFKVTGITISHLISQTSKHDI